MPFSNVMVLSFGMCVVVVRITGLSFAVYVVSFVMVGGKNVPSANSGVCLFSSRENTDWMSISFHVLFSVFSTHRASGTRASVIASNIVDVFFMCIYGSTTLFCVISCLVSCNQL